MPGLENTPLRTNIIIHNFYRSLVYIAKQRQFQNMCFFANKIVFIWSESNTEPLKLNDDEQ
jgi:hypothetical protein